MKCFPGRLLIAAISWVLVHPWFAPKAFAQGGDRRDEAQRLLPADFVVPPAPALPPAESLKTFKLQPGFRIELVASEPLVESPVAMQFDADGRIWVVEMRGYMPNLQGIGETNAAGRVVILEDKNGDGRMDRRTVFLDRLVMPRALCLVRGGLLIAEPPNLWFCRDTDGNGVADEKILVTNDYATQNDPLRGANSNPEHASNGLMLAMDNWIYSLYYPWRYRYDAAGWRREPTISRGQWGISQDDFGRLIYNSNSDQLRGDFVPDYYLNRNPNYQAKGANVQIARDQNVWPVRVTPGVNRGYQRDTLRDGKLAQFTAACGPVVYRGDNFPIEFKGNAFVAEPSANLVHRDIIVEKDGALTATNAYMSTEFLASTDERFRPVNLYNGPDGALYIVDFHRGIIQHRIYMTTFLRKQVEDRGLDKPIDQGRIYRVVYEGNKLRRPSSLLRASAAQLVQSLSDPNGWTRDTAQRLLVERADKSSLARLRKTVVSTKEPLGRLHALWTLEGLRAADEITLRAALQDRDAKVRTAAIRLYEPLVRSNSNVQAMSPLRALLNDPNVDVQWQLAFTLGELHDDTSLMALAARQLEHSYLRDAILSSLGGREIEFLERVLADHTWTEKSPGREAFLRGLASCVFNERKTARLEKMFNWAAQQEGSTTWRQLALLDGALATFPTQRGAANSRPRTVRLENEPNSLVAMGKTESVETRTRSTRLLALLTWPGKAGAEVSAEVKPLTSEEQKRFETGQELYTVTCGACHQAHGNGQEGLAPPMVDSDWITGSTERLARIALQGLRGPINIKGRTYELEMPNLSVLDDDQLAAIFTYIRRAWGHTASAVTPETVAKVRSETKSREEAWTEAELLKVP